MLLHIDFSAEVPNTQRTRAIARVRFDWSNHPKRDASDDFGVSTDAPKRIAFVRSADSNLVELGVVETGFR